MKVIFFGTSSFSAHILAFLIDQGIEILAVITRPDRPQKRSKRLTACAVKTWVLTNHSNLPLYQPEKASTPEMEHCLRAYNPDCFVVVSYGEIISQKLLDIPRIMSLNVHPSLLPKYRGASPIQFALIDGAKTTGVTIIEMTTQMDAGDILAQETIAIPFDITCRELEKKLCDMGANILFKVLHSLSKGEISKIPQKHHEATYVKKITSSMAKLTWDRCAIELHNLVRAFNPKPGAWIDLKIKGQLHRLKVWKSIVVDRLGSPGDILVYDHQQWIVACRKQALSLLEVQLEGKKKLAFPDFFRGQVIPPILKTH